MSKRKDKNIPFEIAKIEARLGVKTTTKIPEHVFTRCAATPLTVDEAIPLLLVLEKEQAERKLFKMRKDLHQLQKRAKQKAIQKATKAVTGGGGDQVEELKKRAPEEFSDKDVESKKKEIEQFEKDHEPAAAEARWRQSIKRRTKSKLRQQRIMERRKRDREAMKAGRTTGSSQNEEDATTSDSDASRSAGNSSTDDHSGDDGSSDSDAESGSASDSDSDGEPSERATKRARLLLLGKSTASAVSRSDTESDAGNERNQGKKRLGQRARKKLGRKKERIDKWKDVREQQEQKLRGMFGKKDAASAGAAATAVHQGSEKHIRFDGETVQQQQKPAHGGRPQQTLTAPAPAQGTAAPQFHPSWEARLKEREKLASIKIDVTGTSGQNKKIVFD